MSTNTIAAIGTALSNSGISIIRISGDKSLDVISRIFKSKSQLEPNKIIYGKIVENDIVIDDVLVSYFKAPRSFTGEDICEINCHGGNEVTREILELVLKNGARLAEAGEFSKRAFLNGKMDLSQAEAVINLINAKTRTEARIASNQLGGKFSSEISDIRGKLLDLMAKIEVCIDYPEYYYEEVTVDSMLKTVDDSIEKLQKIVNSYEQGKYINDGINVAILGKPNVGKSSLLNSLVKYDKAIVTDIPGTTRDIVEDRINIGDVILNISDTAGIRDTDDVIEKIGVEKSIKILDNTDLVLYVLSADSLLEDYDKKMLRKIQNKGIKMIVAINKVDKIKKKIFDTVLNELEQINIENIIQISVLENYNIEKLKETISKLFNTYDLDFEHELIITNTRHKDLLNKAIENLDVCKNEIINNTPIDLIQVYIINGMRSIGEILGTDVSEDVINKIFEKFCVGK